MARGGDWDFTLPGEVSAPAEADPVGGRPAPFRPVTGSIGDAMVYCIGCGEPMSLDAALAHTCDLPPAGRL